MPKSAVLATLSWLALSATVPPPPVVTQVDPLTVVDDDFKRHRSAAEWEGLSATRIQFKEGGTRWRFWRIVNTAPRPGPLWFVPHDDENSGFDAALIAVRKYGGTVIAVDSGINPANDGKRENNAVDSGRAIDPNRVFDARHPEYVRAALTDRGDGTWPIIALHTNALGFNTRASNCNKNDTPPGRGVISIRYCDGTYHPRPSVRQQRPFDQYDNVAIAAYRATGTPSDAFCADKLIADDFNVLLERVAASDGSLSNYIVLNPALRLRYLNFETLNRTDPAGLADGSARLGLMIDRALQLCVQPELRH
jgi:hypothetical protein